jgi:hypothetical protein
VREDGPVGRSLGCPAINPQDFTNLDREGALKGSLIWIDGPVPSLATSASLGCPHAPTPERACKKDASLWAGTTSTTWGIAWVNYSPKDYHWCTNQQGYHEIL